MRVISRHNLRRKAVLEAAALLANEVIQQKNRQRLLECGPTEHHLRSLMTPVELRMFRDAGGTLTGAEKRRLGRTREVDMEVCPAWKHGYRYRSK